MAWQSLQDNSVACDGRTYKNLDYPNSFLEGLNDLRDDAVLCDVILRAGEQTWPVHKCVLAIGSAYFKTMFTSQLKESREREVTLNGIEPTILETLLQFFYTGAVRVTQENLQRLMEASNFLQVLWVRDACSMFVEEHMMDASNCLAIYDFAEAMNCERLNKAATKFALSNFRDVSSHEEFLNLSRARLVELVSSDTLNVTREEDVFTALLKWFNHQPEERKEGFHEVLKNVGLPLMSPSFLYDSVSKQEIMRTSPECNALLQEALLYKMMPDRHGDTQRFRTRPRREGKLVDVKSSACSALPMQLPSRPSVPTVSVIVCVGGHNGMSTLRCVEAFDPFSNKWASLCDLPFAVREHGAAVAGNNTLYIGSSSNQLLGFDPQVNQWEEMARMSHARAGLGMAALNEFLYAVGFESERYNTENNMWEQLPALPTPVYGATVLAHDGYLYVAGGSRGVGNPTKCLQRFDPSTRIWTALAAMTFGRVGSAGCVLDGRLYIIGGFNGTENGNTNEVECYDIRNNQWGRCSPIIGGNRCLSAAAVMDGQIYVLGGRRYLFGTGENELKTVERYSPAFDRWEHVSEMTMTSARSALTCNVFQVPRSLLSSGTRR